MFYVIIVRMIVNDLNMLSMLQDELFSSTELLLLANHTKLIYNHVCIIFKFLIKDIFSHETGYANLTTFARVSSFLGAGCNPLLSAVTYDRLGLPVPQMQIPQVTCP